MKFVAQLCERAGRRHYDDGLDMLTADQLFEGIRYTMCKTALFYFVPIRHFDAAPEICCCALEHADWPISALLVSWGIVVNKQFSVTKFGNLSSPLLRKNNAFCPSPTNTTVSCGMEIRLFMGLALELIRQLDP
jgi:hypothetical protein